MVTVVGVRFREVGKIYYFAPGDLELKRGTHVIVDTSRGQEYGTVMLESRQVEDEEIVQPLKAVDRIATKDDEEREAANRDKEKDAFNICKARIREHKLEMKLISAEYAFDNSKILFCFTADGRVDFRDLVKDLAAIFKIRIELRQVGVRDETKIMGGIGYCGRPLCCCSYLSDFVPVSIKMAKEQNLSLNPQKISGMCGRLMCCLKNEVEAYEDLNTRLPKQGAKIQTKDGREGVAQNVNVLRETIQVLFVDDKGNKEVEEFPASELKFTPRRKKPGCASCGNCQGGASSDKTARTGADGSGVEDDLTEELTEEAAQETDPELRALEAEELSDVKAAEVQAAEGSGDTLHRPRRKRRASDGEHRHSYDTGERRERQNGQNRSNRTDRASRQEGSRSEGSHSQGKHLEGNRPEGQNRTRRAASDADPQNSQQKAGTDGGRRDERRRNRNSNQARNQDINQNASRGSNQNQSQDQGSSSDQGQRKQYDNSRRRNRSNYDRKRSGTGGTASGSAGTGAGGEA